jgi:hypothetical protein
MLVVRRPGTGVGLARTRWGTGSESGFGRGVEVRRARRRNVVSGTAATPMLWLGMTLLQQWSAVRERPAASSGIVPAGRIPTAWL